MYIDIEELPDTIDRISAANGKLVVGNEVLQAYSRVE